MVALEFEAHRGDYVRCVELHEKHPEFSTSGNNLPQNLEHQSLYAAYRNATRAIGDKAINIQKDGTVDILFFRSLGWVITTDWYYGMRYLPEHAQGDAASPLGTSIDTYSIERQWQVYRYTDP